MYEIKLDNKIDKIFNKLEKKNKKRLKIVLKKLKQIKENPHRYKNLKAPLNHLKRVHINSHFVLTFAVDEENKTIILIDFEHHDLVYE